VLLSGGETTVTIAGGAADARGGRASELSLALALALGGDPRISALVADTDGIDGSGPHAGAMVAPDTLARLAAGGLDAKSLLAAHQSYNAFAALDALVVTGPTRTNVNDFRAILVTAP
jgi:hydroxypyruvate reductase